MPEEIRALIFIFIIISLPLALFIRFASYLSLKAEAKQWAVIWAITTILAFLLPNFWIFSVFITILLLVFTKNNPILKICLFFVLLPSLPAASIAIPGFDIINYFFNINFPLLLSIILLLPLAFSRSSPNRATKSIRYFIYSFFLLFVIVHYQESSSVHKGGVIIRESSFTEVLRYGFILGLTILVPYLAMSKTIKSSTDINKLLLAIVFGIFLQACIGIAETLKDWHLYNAATESMGISWGTGGYQMREGLLRASAALGHSITFGYTLVIGLGLLLNFYSPKHPKAHRIFWFILVILSTGLLATLSRGPWVGAAAMIIFYFLIADKSFKNLTKLGLIAVLSLSILSLFPVGQRFIELLPYMSSETDTHAAGTISYRERLMEQSWKVIQKNPFFGSANYMDTPEMEVMRQGEGIIDMVNTYLAIALEIGLVGLSLFLMIFIITLSRIYKIISRLKRKPEYENQWLQGRSIFAAVIGIMVIIFTVSSIGVTSFYYWSILGIAAAYINIAKQNPIPKN